MPGLRRKDEARSMSSALFPFNGMLIPHSFEPAGLVLIGPALEADLIRVKEKGPPEGRPFVLIAAAYRMCFTVTVESTLPRMTMLPSVAISFAKRLGLSMRTSSVPSTSGWMRRSSFVSPTWTR